MDNTESAPTSTIAGMFAIVALLMIVAFIAWQAGLLDP